MNMANQQTNGISKTVKQLKNAVGGDVGGIFNKLKTSGISEQFQSWIGKGENKPVTAEQITEALGNEHIAKIADQTGVAPGQAAQDLARKLPSLVDKMTPDGQLPDKFARSDASVGVRARSDASVL
ncbi:MAG: hypothetical protein AUG49_02275 [Catenulispora sp. 13_1_20CM_3_70_7]|jgi:uncharacterized protein YidB (DUF937 family)|nr:MAG: hypothetical protein AUG49_02275 [Catenulispora sp. 13_1_20CM_3_70_7]